MPHQNGSHSDMETQPMQPQASAAKPAVSPATFADLRGKLDRNKRANLRRVQAHLLNTVGKLGAQRQVMDMVEVVWHPYNDHANLNFMTPRQKVIMIPTASIERGEAHLREHRREPRMFYLDGLVPPSIIGITLRKLAFTATDRVLLLGAEAANLSTLPTTPETSELTIVEQAGNSPLWQATRNDDCYQLIISELDCGVSDAVTHFDVMQRQNGELAGLLRVIVDEDTAHIVLAAVHKTHHTLASTRALFQKALATLVARGATLVFAAGNNADACDTLFALGLVDFGSRVCYAARVESEADDQVNSATSLV